MATRAGGNLTIGNTTAVNLFTQGNRLFFFGESGLGRFAGQEIRHIAHVGVAQLGSKTHHDSVGTLARFVLLQLLDDVFRVLLRQLGVDGGA